MNKLTILCGIPGSGKSTWAQNNGWRTGAFTICPDSYREKFTGSPSNMSRDKEVWAACYKDLEDWLKLGRNVVYDATSRNRKSRKKLIDIAKRQGVEVTAVFFKTPFWKCVWRNFWRERRVPVKVIWNMLKTLEKPLLSEGFKEIKVIK